MSSLLRLIATNGLVVLTFFGLASCLRAGDLKEPYRVRIVVDVEKHRALTDIFRKQVSREIRDGLKSALGDLATVSVDDKHSLLAEIQAKGLGRALDGVRQRSPERTYFVTIKFNGTHYHIQTRMLDGLTGLPSPVVRQASTRDRPFVARRATLLLERDLGLLGTVVSEPTKQGIVTVELRGGGLGVELGTWVKKGEVFALVKVDGAGPGVQLPWALLQVIEPAQNGLCRCKFFSRYQLGRVTGLRAVLLGTTSGPVRLRLLEEKDNRELGPLQSAVRVQIRHNSFDDSSPLPSQTASRGRDIDTSRLKDTGQFDKIAFVSVLFGENVRARFPIAILDDRVVVAGVPPGNDEQDLIRFRHRALVRNVFDAAQVQSEMFSEINALSSKADQRVLAIKRVKETLERSRKDYNRLTEERDKVRKELPKLPERGRPNMAGINDRLKLLKSGEDELMKTIAALEKIDKEENDPEKKEWLLQKEKAHLLETEGEIDKAIAIYEKMPDKFLTPKLKGHLDNLKKMWNPKNADHKKAREFILNMYPTMTTEQLKEGVVKAREALEVCKKADDLIGPARLRRATLEHVKRLDMEASALNPSVNIDDEKPLRAIKDLFPKLREIVEDVGAYLEKKK